MKEVSTNGEIVDQNQSDTLQLQIRTCIRPATFALWWLCRGRRLEWTSGEPGDVTSTLGFSHPAITSV